MSALSPTSMPDVVTYNFLHTANQLTEALADAGDVKVEELTYWHPTDPDASGQGAKLYGYGLVHYCLVHADFYGTAWKLPTLPAQAAAISKLVTVMDTSSSLVSDISTQLGTMFTFTAPAAKAAT